MAAIINKLLKLNGLTKALSFIPILILVFVIFIWSSEVINFFNGQLSQGFGAFDKQLMRGQLLSFLDDLSDKEKSLFYFDFSEDKINGYYYDNIILGGFGSWILWHEKINFRHELIPDAIWSQFEQLESAKSIKNNGIGFNLRGNFYSLENFYAFKLKDKRIFDIKEDILKRLNIKDNTCC